MSLSYYDPFYWYERELDREYEENFNQANEEERIKNDLFTNNRTRTSPDDKLS